MTLDELLERGLAGTADDYDVPAGAVERLREQLAPDNEVQDVVRRRTRVRDWLGDHRGLVAAAAALLIVIALPISLGGAGGGTDSGGGGSTAASSATGAEAAGGSAGGSNAVKAPALDDQRHVPVAAPPVYGAQGATTGSSAGTAAGGASAPELSVPGPVPAARTRIVKTGQLDLQVAKGEVSHTLDRLSGVATLEHGYVASSRTSEGGDAPSGVMTLRVPVDNFEQAVSRARDLGRVLALETSGQDVTGKYVDLQARIKALQATRATFLTILSKATTIGQTLAVQDRITQVQTQIEQLQGQLKVLAGESAMSTLTVSVGQKSSFATTAPHEDNGFVKAVKLSVSRFVRGVEAIVGVIGPILLALLLVVLGWLAARFGYRATRRHLV
jgi:hypothetical protein